MRRLVPALLILLGLFAAACGSDSDSSGTTTDDGAVTVTTAETTTTTTAVSAPGSSGDDPGTFAGTPSAIVSLNPSATEMLFAIGAGEQVMAVDNFSYYPPEAPVIEDLSAFDPNIEAIADLEPDLVVLPDAGIVDQLDGLGINSLVLPASVTIDDTYTQIEQLGAVTGRVGDAAQLVADMQADIAAAVDGFAAPATPPTYYHELDDTLFSVTSDTFIGEVYALFGLENVADAVNDDTTYPQLTEEFLLAADPDLIFLADTVCCGQTADTLAARPGWDALTAVTAGTVIELDDDVASRWGPRIVEFVDAIAAALAQIPAPA
ncbi:MAG: ABC transporter substrate-binding protein [Acidimicrobiia bacterium]|nr:ABC transporter substrate-binding protein [Acidimicrobiia bacterium]MDH5236934.1 ABC transporter substrate-binding protein [Acidimicrobiia bacterium]